MERNIKKFYLFSLFNGLQFFWPILVIFQKERIGSFAALAVIQVFYNVLSFFLEVPTGYFADKYGRKILVNISLICYMVASMLYFFLSNWMLFILVEIFWAIGTVCFSGAYDAFMYDSTIVHCSKEQATKIYSTVSIIGNITLALSNLGGSVIANYFGKQYCFLITAVFFGVSFLIIQRIDEEDNHNVHNQNITKCMTPKVFVKDNVRILKSIISNVELRNNLIDIVLINGIVYMGLFFSQPLFVERGLSILLFGVVYAVTNLSKSLIVKLSILILKIVSEKKVIFVSEVIIMISFILVFFIPNIYYSIFAIIATQSVLAIRSVIYSILNNSLILQQERATVLSYFSLVNSAWISLLMLVFGMIADKVDKGLLYLIIGIICSIPILIKIIVSTNKGKILNEQNQSV